MRTLLALLLLASALPARADIYTWTDKDGVEHFSSSPPDDAPKKGTIKKHKSRSPDPAPPSAPVAAGAPTAGGARPAAQRPAPRIVLHTTSWCQVCRAARAYLNARGLAYEDYDIETDAAAYQRYKGLGGRGVPLAVIDGSVVNGFAAPLYDQMLPR